MIVGGWYVTGHLGYVAEDPKTLEEAFVATNSGRAESYSFVAPTAYLLELLLLWSDQSKLVTFGIAGVLGMAAGSAAMALATAGVPLGRLRLDRGPRQPYRRRRVNGIWRRHRAGLHDRPGVDRHFDPGAGIVPRSGGDRRRLRGGVEIPVLAAGQASPDEGFTHDRVRPGLRAAASLRGLVRLDRGLTRASTTRR